MAIKSLFFVVRDGRKSVLEVSEYVIDALKKMSALDEAFSVAYFLYKKESVSFEVNKYGAEEELARHILAHSKSDIAKFDRIVNPDSVLSRSYGFTFGLQFMDGGGKLISLTFKLGGDKGNKIGTISIAKNLNREWKWYRWVIDSFAWSGWIQCASVRPNDPSYLEWCVKSFKFPLGWITYFSNDYEIPIPDDLEGIEYEYTDKGKYLILTRKDFTDSKEKYEAAKLRLLELMEEIKRRVPEYAK